MTALLHPTYFGSIANYVALLQSENVIFEVCDNFQKQTLRNRTYIYGANGKLLLNLPIIHSKNGIKSLYKDIKLEHQFGTLKNHWKSLESAYRTSPYFEFYEDELAHLFEQQPQFLLDFNFECQSIILDCLQLDINFKKTTNYEVNPSENITDYRNLVNAKNKITGVDFKPYPQVFQNKYGFIPNLSILDLLFNEGPNTSTYLEAQASSLL